MPYSSLNSIHEGGYCGSVLGCHVLCSGSHASTMILIISPCEPFAIFISVLMFEVTITFAPIVTCTISRSFAPLRTALFFHFDPFVCSTLAHFSSSVNSHPLIVSSALHETRGCFVFLQCSSNAA